MIALHGGYKANIKAAHMAAHHFKGCGERGGRGSPQWLASCGQVTGTKAEWGGPVAEPPLLFSGGKLFFFRWFEPRADELKRAQTLLTFQSGFTPVSSRLQVDLLTFG